jgi:hypothetical protein
MLTVAMLLLGVFDDKGAIAVHKQSAKLNSIQSENQALDAKSRTQSRYR